MAEHEIRRLDIEQYMAGELEKGQCDGLEAHVVSCEKCSAYLVQLKQERDSFLRVHPYAALGKNAVQKEKAPWYEILRKVIAWPIPQPLLVPACLLLFVAVMSVPFYTSVVWHKPAQNAVIRSKGPLRTAPELSYIYKREGIVRGPSSVDVFQAGDMIQIYYSSSAEEYLTLFSIDRSGTLSFYQPEAASAVCSIRTGTGKRIAYPLSIALDTSTGAELIVGLFSNQPTDTAHIKTWIAGLDKGTDATMTTLETSIKNNPPAGQNRVATLLLKKG